MIASLIHFHVPASRVVVVSVVMKAICLLSIEPEFDDRPVMTNKFIHQRENERESSRYGNIDYFIWPPLRMILQLQLQLLRPPHDNGINFNKQSSRARFGCANWLFER